jgi:hypothetical protein
MRIDHATRLAIGSRERWETELRVMERTGGQLQVQQPFQRSIVPYDVPLRRGRFPHLWR